MDEHDELLQRLRHLGAQPIEPSRQAADLVAMAGVRRPPRSRPGFLASKVRVAAAFLAGLLLGGTGLAAADALPDPAQHVAHTVLAQVGVDVPNPERYHGPECGADAKKNHGAYVRDDHALAQSDCGKPVGAGNKGENGQGNGPAADKGPCQGRPPWAGNKTMTDAEVAAAKAQRTALCGDDGDDAEADANEAEVEAEEREVDAESTTTTSAAPTTTEAPTTTAAPTTTTESTTTSSTSTTATP